MIAGRAVSAQLLRWRVEADAAALAGNAVRLNGLWYQVQGLVDLLLSAGLGGGKGYTMAQSLQAHIEKALTDVEKRPPAVPGPTV